MGRALVDQALEQAVRHHRAGDLSRAEAIYRQVLAVEPGNPDATHLLGMIAHASGRLAEAVDLMQRAIGRAPRVPHYHANLANALRDSGRTADAIAAYEHAISLGDPSAEVRNNLGIVLLQLGRDEEAAEWFRASLALRSAGGSDRAGVLCNLASALTRLGQHDEAVRAARDAAAASPDLAAAHAALGSALAGAGRFDEARSAFERALAIAPAMCEAHLGLADVLGRIGEGARAIESAMRATELRPTDHAAWTALGVALLGDQRREEAIAAFQRAVAILPGFSPAYANMGVAFSELGRHSESLEALRQAAELAPHDPTPLRNLAIALLTMNSDDRALEAARRALEIDPKDPATIGLVSALTGHAHEREGRFAQAMTDYELAAALAPETPLNSVRLGTMLLRLGQFERGWAHYEHRHHFEAYRNLARQFNVPRWSRALAKPTDTVILAGEQGLGDAIQFVRFAAELRRRSGRVVLYVRPELADILSTAPGVDQVVAVGQPLPRADAWLPMLSAPHDLGFDLSTVGAGVPYLAADMVSAALWKREIDRLEAAHGSGRGLRVGLVWAGNPEYHDDRGRSISGPTLLPLATAPGVTWFSLQKGKGASDLPGLAEAGWRMHDLGSRCATFGDTAAVMSGLDLVISVDTSAAHLAGALGKPVWILNRFVPEWRWLDGREDSPWYSTARLFKQRAPGDWGEVLVRVQRELTAMAARRA
jgi:tetratricopeptide (TPR) repeat protein